MTNHFIIFYCSAEKSDIVVILNMNPCRKELYLLIVDAYYAYSEKK